MTLKRPKAKSQKFTPTLQLIAATVLFAISAWLARDSALSGPEKYVFDTIYAWPASLHLPFLIITQLGSVYLLIVFSIAVAVKAHYHIVLRLLMTGVLAYLLAGVAKDLVGRPRPIELLADIIHRDYFIRGPGFPSGHTALAAAMAFTWGHYAPRRYAWTVPFIIIGVGLSRIYLGAHLPLDIVGGFAIGWAAYALFRHVRLVDIRAAKAKKASSSKTAV